MEFPTMLYRDGTPGPDWRIARDIEQVKALNAQGYYSPDGPAEPEAAPAKRGRPRKEA